MPFSQHTVAVSLPSGCQNSHLQFDAVVAGVRNVLQEEYKEMWCAGLGVCLFLILSFKINSSYERWWEVSVDFAC